MTAAYRLKGIGWFAGIVAIVLGFYLVSLQVAGERKKLEGVEAKIAAATRDVRALETEFDTRANLVQLERWNGDTLALAAPSAAQYVSDETQLAAIDVTAAGPAVKTAQLVVPAGVTLPQTLPAAALPAAPAAAPMVTLASATHGVAPAIAVQHGGVAAAFAPGPATRGTPALASLEQAHRATAAVAHVRPQALASLDKKLLSDATLGDILSGARAESGRRH